jgi:hypothetical protein
VCVFALIAVAQLVDLGDDGEATLLDDHGELKEEVKLLPRYRQIASLPFAQGIDQPPDESL